MANSIQVTPKTLTNKANELKSLNSRFKNQYENLKATESRLNGMWEGEAKTQFHNAFSKDIVQMQNFHDLIDRYVQSLNQIAAKYQAAESKNVSIASQRKYS